MRDLLRNWAVFLAALALVLGACSDDNGGGGTPDADAGGDADGGGDMLPDGEPDMVPDGDVSPDVEPDMAPPVYAVATFFIDDSANGTYTAADGLAWKGSFNYDAETNVATYDSAWGGPFIPLYDDGPIADGGHEAPDATADDHIWTVAVNVAIPDADQEYAYGAIRGSTDGSDGEWIWVGDNGAFTVPADAEEGDVIDAAGLVIPEFGWIDMRFSLDGTAIDSDFSTTAPSAVQVKSSAWGWSLIDLTEGDADQWSVVLSDVVGEGTDLPHNGLLRAGDEPQFVFVLDDVEYKVSGVPPATGVTVEYALYDTWNELTIANQAEGDQNTYVTVPFAPVRDTVVATFCIDDTANASYGSECAAEDPTCDGLAWKGSFSYDAERRQLNYDSAWGGPFALLWDDGPWSAGGHEPADATADDNIWCIAAFAPIPDADQEYAYGAISGSDAGSDGQWIWVGDNGAFTVAADASEGDAVDATGLVIPEWGSIDARFTIDGTALDAAFSTTAPDAVNIKGSAWGWVEVPMTDDGSQDDTADDDVWSMVLSDNVGAGTDLIHYGLLNNDQVAQFVFVIDGVEYKVGGAAATAGVSAEVDTGSGWVDSTVEVQGEGDMNTYITAPAAQ